MLQRLGFAEKGRGSYAAGALVCLCLFAADPGSHAQDNALPPVFATWTCQYTGVRRTASVLPGKTLVQKKQRIVARWIKALKNRNSAVRKNATIALGELKSPRAVAPLVAALSDRDEIVRACAGESLVKIGAPAVPPLTAALKHNDPFVPALAALALSGIPDPRAHQAIMAALSERNTKAILGVHTYFVKLGQPGSESALTQTLQQFPNQVMAEEFLNSGNPTLAAAANAWAAKYKQKIVPNPTGDVVRWGSGNPTPPADLAQQPPADAPKAADQSPLKNQASDQPPPARKVTPDEAVDQ